MKEVKSLNEISDEKLAITIGNFDGVHFGHQSILREIKSYCDNNDCKLVVITFSPHPMQIFSPQDNFLLNSNRERKELLKNCQVDYLVELEFNRDLSTMEPSDFMDKFLLCNEGVEHFFIGHDFAFGANKAGNHEFVLSYCKDKNVEIHILSQHILRDSKVSSSLIRNLLDEGKVNEASSLLGRDFYISGRVIKGEGRGRTIGIPTANLSYSSNRKVPRKGVYITETRVGDTLWQSITNIGNNPTFNETRELFVETHILDFNNDIYGDEIVVNFKKRLRDERKFNGVNELIDQIKNDIIKARAYFER